MKKSTLLTMVLLAGAASPGAAQWTSGRADGHAPIGIMGDHTHESGETMFSYRYMYMNMTGSRDGTNAVADGDIVAAGGRYGFTVTPTDMPMQMHMFGVMHAPVDRLTIMVMLPFLDMSMDHLTRAGGMFSTHSSGIGDVRVSGLIQLSTFGNQSVHATAGVSLPTGSIERMDVTPMSRPDEAQLPYPMQVGSGTFDVMPGITYLGQTADWSWGAQGRAVVRIGRNDRDYTLGNQYVGTVWGARRFVNEFSASIRVEAARIENIDGADAALNPSFVPTANPDLRGGTRVDVGVGMNAYIRRGPLRGLRFAVEGFLPALQDLDGPQLETDWTIIAGAQYTP